MSGPDAIDTIVIGGGIVGASIAYGLARRGETIRLLDEGDDAFRAARGNFGLVWVQGKGLGKPAYARWSMESSRLWPALAEDLSLQTGVDLQLSQPGGLSFCLDEAELDERTQMLAALGREVGEPYPYEILGANAVRELCPHVGPDVVGASYCPLDGHVSPLNLLRSLTQAMIGLGGDLQTGQRVEGIDHRGGAFYVRAGGNLHVAAKVVLAAGLGNRHLAPLVGLHAPVEPVRGQILISERLERFLDLPTVTVRQTGDGGVQIGDSKEEVGFDDGTTIPELARMAARAARYFPMLANVNIVRTWGALRVMTPDGYPLYQASTECPGAFVITCHSGITLAAQHAGPVAGWIHGGPEPQALGHFKAERFHV